MDNLNSTTIFLKNLPVYSYLRLHPLCDHHLLRGRRVHVSHLPSSHSVAQFVATPSGMSSQIDDKDMSKGDESEKEIAALI